jgi:hypothetical protein
MPSTNNFWTAVENEGPWEREFDKSKVYNKYLPGPQILITDYPGIGAAEIRAWCHVPVGTASEPFRGSENYNRLAYNSAFPWQADSSNGTVAMNYVFKNGKNEWEPLRLYDFVTFEHGIFYRNAMLETNKNIRIQLADIPLANGILRIDRNVSTDTAEFRLGHYALPNVKGVIKEHRRKVKGHEVRIIDNGVYQLAMVVVNGRADMEIVAAKGLNPVANDSKVINAFGKFEPGNEKYAVNVVLMLWKRSGQLWSDNELVPITRVDRSVDGKKITVMFTNGEKKLVRFE